jgi:hypothetical protein
MTDTTLNPVRPIRPIRLSQTKLLAFTFLLANGVSFASVYTQAKERRCDSPLGELAVKLKLDSYYSSCQCMTHTFDFSDACNSGLYWML